MQAISVIAKVSISIDLHKELRGDFFQCLTARLTKSYIKTLTQNANSNGGDASRVGIAKGKAYKLC